MPMDFQFVSEPTVGMLACAEYVFDLLGIRSQGSIKQSWEGSNKTLASEYLQYGFMSLNVV